MFETPRSATAVLKGTGGAAARPRILVVDEAKAMRELLALHLGNAGYEVRAVEDAVVGARLVLERPPDLLITDITLPYMDGIAFVRALQEDPGIPDIPVVIITARDDLSAELGRLRAAACLKKPVHLERLLQVVDLYLRPATP